MGNFSEINKKILKDVTILVEGVSDIAFLNLFLCKKYGFRYLESSNIRNISEKMTGEKYENDKYHLEIYSVGGVNCFNEGYRNIKDTIKAKTKFLVTIIDSDDRTKEEITNELHFDDIKLECDKFVDYYKDDFIELNFKTYLKVIPSNKPGALENVILDVISKNDEEIVNCSNCFVEGLSDKASRYINKKRLKLKAKTGVVFSLLSPDKTFERLREKFKLVDLNDPDIIEAFGFFDEIFK